MSVLGGLGTASSRGVGLHEEGVGGKEPPVDDEQAVVGSLRPTRHPRAVLVEGPSDTSSQEGEVEETEVADDGRPVVPDTGDVPAHGRGRNTVVVLALPGDPGSVTPNATTKKVTETSLPVSEVREENTFVTLVEVKDTGGRR